MLPSAPISGRLPGAVVWTGREMVVWGGAAELCDRPLSDGAAYDPATRAWRKVAPGPLRGGCGYSGVWTGEHVLVFGPAQTSATGEVQQPAAALYDPGADRWTAAARFPLAARHASTHVWTGRELVVLGGQLSEGPGLSPRDAAAYDPTTDRWRRIADLPFEPRLSWTAVWTGTEVVVWGGSAGDVVSAEGAAYDPARDRWRTIASSPLKPRVGHAAVWTGETMVVWGGGLRHDGEELSDGAAYEPGKDAWVALPASPLSARREMEAHWTGAEVVLWGGAASGPADAKTWRLDGAAYDPATSEWRLLASAPLTGRLARSAWTAHGLAIWGGWGSGNPPQDLADGAMLSVRRDAGTQ